MVLGDGGIVAAQLDGYWLVVADAAHRSDPMMFGTFDTDTTLVNVVFGTGAFDPNDGVYNTDVLTSPPYDTLVDAVSTVGCPPAEYCRALGGDWFLGNIQEYEAVLANVDLIDSVDTSGGDKTFASMYGLNLWASTENTKLNGWYIRMFDAYSRYAAKNGLYTVVPIRRALI